MHNKASHNLISVNPHQFAALLARRYGEVLVAGVEGPNPAMVARLLATLMQEFNGEWVPFLKEHTDDPLAALPAATFNHSSEAVPLTSIFVNFDEDRLYVVKPIPLRELEIPRFMAAGVVMVTNSPVGYADTSKYMFELFTQIDGLIYSTGIAQDRESKDVIRLTTSTMARRDITRHLAQPLASTETRTSLDLWLDVNYHFLASYQRFFNEYLVKGEPQLEEIEDFREGIERAALLETNQLPPKALKVTVVPKLRPIRKDRQGTDGDVALQSLKSVGDLSFFQVPKQYANCPLSGVRVAEDPEVAGEFVVYLAFTMPSGGFEEQVVISGRNFKAIYSAANQLADATLISIHYSVDVDKHFEQ